MRIRNVCGIVLFTFGQLAIMAFLFRRNKSKAEVQSNASTNKRALSTRILQINLEELKQKIDAEDEAKKQQNSTKLLAKTNKKDESKSTECPDIKFRIEVEYNTQSWTVDRALAEFIGLRKALQTATKKQLRPFALFPYGVSGSGSAPNISSDSESQSKKSKFALSSIPKSGAMASNPVTNPNVATAEAPFLREMRLALDRWLDAVTANPDIQENAR